MFLALFYLKKKKYILMKRLKNTLSKLQPSEKNSQANNFSLRKKKNSSSQINPL